ncbi:MAG: leucine-rich repeat protein [Treponema sp.]|nr:leucine-rich repeat protein [Treponema sp.]
MQGNNIIFNFCKLKLALFALSLCALTAATCVLWDDIDTLRDRARGEGDKGTLADCIEFGHYWGDWLVIKEATEDEGGIEERTCQREGCNETEIKHTSATGEPGHEHDWGDWEETTPATCLSSGAERRVCSHNASHYETRPISALGHNWGDWEETTPATCLIPGEERRVCSRDASHIETNSITALGHAWGNWIETTPATCTAPGEEIRYCSHDASHIEINPITALEHDWGEWEVIREATETEDGEEIRTCQRDDCNETETRYPPATGVGTPSLAFTLIDNGTAYSVSLGTATAAEIVIPAVYNELPVTEIGSYGFSSSNLTSIVIPNSVTSIGSFAFYICTSLTSIVIPNNLTSIGDYAFGGCTSLTNIVIPNSVTSIGDSAFYQCTSLTSIVIPNSVTSIGDAAFAHCTNLTSIVIPNNLTSIGDYAFVGCTSLTNIVIPNSVTSIGQSAFSDCTSLTSIVIPNSVTSIGSNVFAGCTSLTSIVIPNSVTSIGESAFAYCDNLSTVFYGGSDNTAWSAISIGAENESLSSATLYYYSEGHPGTNNTHWRWVDGEPTIWANTSDFNITLSFSNIPPITAGPIYLLDGEGRPSSVNITVASSANYDDGSIKWYLNGSLITDNISGTRGQTLTVNTTDYNRIGLYSITVEAQINGRLYSRIVTFEVKP